MAIKAETTQSMSKTNPSDKMLFVESFEECNYKAYSLRVSVIQSEATIRSPGKHFLLLVASLYHISVSFYWVSLEMTA